MKTHLASPFHDGPQQKVNVAGFSKPP